MKSQLYIAILILIATSYISCYSFKGISIPAEVKNYYVNQVKLTAQEAPATITDVFRETLRRKVRQQSSLTWEEREPDVEFLATVSNYNVTTEAAGEASTVTLNKLSITVSVEYINNLDDTDTWKKNFNYGVPFDPNIDLRASQDEFIDDIFDQITEQIFNEAFAQW